jgi:hypothetical protein
MWFITPLIRERTKPQFPRANTSSMLSKIGSSNTCTFVSFATFDATTSLRFSTVASIVSMVVTYSVTVLFAQTLPPWYAMRPLRTVWSPS